MYLYITPEHAGEYFSKDYQILNVEIVKIEHDTINFVG